MVALCCFLLIKGCLWAEHAFQFAFTLFPHAFLVITPISFVVLSALVQFYFKGAEGSGIPQTLVALENENLAAKTLSMRALIGKFLLIPAYLVGASMGYEGPAVQIGSAICRQTLLAFGVYHLRLLEILYVAGGGAGIAAAFGAPLSGIIFAIEELHHKNLHDFSHAALAIILLSGLFCEIVFGHYIYLGDSTQQLHVSLAGWLGLAIIPLCGIIGGSMGALLSMGLYRFVKNIKPRLHFLILPLFCGLILSILNLWTQGDFAGSGQDFIQSLINGASVYHFAFLFKALATFCTFLAGLPAGLLTPSLTIGASLGQCISAWFGLGTSHYIVLLMMATFLTGVTQAPLTSFVIVMEITGADSILAPLIASSFIAFAVARKCMKEPLYSALKNLVVKNQGPIS